MEEELQRLIDSELNYMETSSISRGCETLLSFVRAEAALAKAKDEVSRAVASKIPCEPLEEEGVASEAKELEKLLRLLRIGRTEEAHRTSSKSNKTVQLASTLMEKYVPSGLAEISTSSSAIQSGDKQTGGENPRKVRFEWDQTDEAVSLILHAQLLIPDTSEVELDKDTVSFSLSRKDQPDYILDLGLPGEIDLAKSSYEMKEDIVIVSMRKKVPSVLWELPEVESWGKRDRKNWDEVLANFKDPQRDSVDDLLKNIYKGADDDTRKAMIKSMQESNGTVLSTNWSEVKEKRTEYKGPT